MAKSTQSRATLKAWLRDRLTQGDRCKEEWRALLEASWDYLLETKVRDLIDTEAAKALADQLADPDLIGELSQPLAEEITRAVVREMRGDEEPLGRFMPQEAQDRLNEVLARPGLIHPELVRQVFRGKAAEAVLNDTLYRALVDFSTLLPRLMVKVSPIGRLGVLGSAGRLMERMIGELEKLIEPEIRSFLADSTGRILERAADFAVAKMDDPTSIEFRRNLAEFVLSNSPAFHVEPLDDQLLTEINEIVDLTRRHVVQMPEIHEKIHVWIDEAMSHVGNQTVAELLQIEPSEVEPPLGALADATWPAFETMLRSPQVQSWMDTLVDDLLDEYEGASGS